MQCIHPADLKHEVDRLWSLTALATLGSVCHGTFSSVWCKVALGHARVITEHVGTCVPKVTNTTNGFFCRGPFSAWIDQQHCATLTAVEFRSENSGRAGVNSLARWW